MERPTISPEHLQEAAENLSTIRDFIRFGVSALRQYDAHLGQGTEDYFAESSACFYKPYLLNGQQIQRF